MQSSEFAVARPTDGIEGMHNRNIGSSLFRVVAGNHYGCNHLKGECRAKSCNRKRPNPSSWAMIAHIVPPRHWHNPLTTTSRAARTRHHPGHASQACTAQAGDEPLVRHVSLQPLVLDRRAQLRIVLGKKDLLALLREQHIPDLAAETPVVEHISVPLS